MKDKLPLPQEKKLTVIFRLESGCLGPQGDGHIDEFCQIAQTKFQSLYSDIVHWDIVPRRDKSLPEMQYLINNKKLNHKQAAKFLDVFNESLSELESRVHKKLTNLIEQYLGH